MILIVILRDVNFSAFIGSSIVSFVFSFFLYFTSRCQLHPGFSVHLTYCVLLHVISFSGK